MRNLWDLARQPIVIGTFVLALLIVVGSYIGGHWYYGDIEPIDTPEYSPTFTPQPSEAEPVPQINLEGLTVLPVESDPPPIELDTTVTSPGAESVEDFLAGLSPEEIQLLTEEVAEALPPPESIHGLGPYPEIPPDYPYQNIWETLERYYDDGHATIEHELIHRVLIKLWNQGKKTESAVLCSKNGRVYPLYRDTVYFTHVEYKNADGTSEGSKGHYRSHYCLASYEEAVMEGTQPSWLKVISIEDGGLEPYSFLGLD